MSDPLRLVPICETPTAKYPSGRRGLPAGYQAHRRRSEQPCEECQDAHITACRAVWANRTVEQRAKRREDNRRESARYRRESPEKYRAAQYRLIAARKEIINAAKDMPCADCAIKYPPHVMQFDHLRDKQFQIGNSYTYALDRVIAEIAKCEVVCANCHAERTHQRWMEGRTNDHATG